MRVYYKNTLPKRRTPRQDANKQKPNQIYPNRKNFRKFNQCACAMLPRPKIIVVHINEMKTIFDFNFDVHQALKQHGYILARKLREHVNLMIIFVFCKLVI